MSGLPNSLNIAIWFVASLCVVGGVAYYFGYPGEMVLVVALLGAGVAWAEWNSHRNADER
jgi:hypothetical protein